MMEKRKRDNRPRRWAWGIVLVAGLVIGLMSVVYGLSRPQSPILWPSQSEVMLYGGQDYRFDVSTQTLTHTQRSTFSPDGQWWLHWLDSGAMDYSRYLILSHVSQPENQHNLGRFYGATTKLDWSPDGQWVALSAYSSPNGRWRPEKLNIHLLNVTTGELEPLVTNLDRDDFPLFSPDGKRLAYRHKEYLWVVTLRTKNVRSLPITQPVEAFGWSDDGQWLVVLVARHEWSSSEKAEVWVMRADGTSSQVMLSSVLKS